MNVGILSLTLDVGDAMTLKDKRRLVKSLKDRLSHRFNISVAEVGSLDRIRTAELGVAMVSNDVQHVSAALSQVVNYVQNDSELVLEHYSIEVV